MRGPLQDPSGWVIDYADIKKVAQPLIDQLDHYYLNDIKGLENPTAEVLARWVYDRLRKELPQLTQVIIAETCTSKTHPHFRQQLEYYPLGFSSSERAGRPWGRDVRCKTQLTEEWPGKAHWP